MITPRLFSQTTRAATRNINSRLSRFSVIQQKRGAGTAATMATSYKIHVKPDESGLLHFERDQKTASVVSDLLQEDLEKHHVFFNALGFHDHITHHLLTLYGTGASAESLHSAYRTNASYQMRAQKPRPNVIDALRSDWAGNAKDYLGKGKHYPEFLQFFQEEIEAKGWRDVVKEHLFSGSQTSDDIFGRLFAGFLHPMIQLMYGIEWEQPAIVAQGLAQAAVHMDRLTPFLAKAEEAAYKSSSSSSFTQPDLLEEVRNSEKLSRSAEWHGDGPLNGVLDRAADEALKVVSKVKVKEDELDERTAEMIHTAAFVSAGAAFRRPYVPRMDFFLIHTLTSSPIFLSVNKQDWIPQAQKVRLLEWKMRVDILLYLAQRCPALDASGLTDFTPRDPEPVKSSSELLSRFYDTPDDGHTIKVIRSLLLAEQVSKKYEGSKWMRIRQKDWVKAHYVLLESIENQGDEGEWVRGAGFEEAWSGHPKL